MKVRTIVTITIVCLVLCWNSVASVAQSAGMAEADSLVRLLSQPMDDTLKARTYKKISELYTVSNMAKALQYANVGLRHVTAMKWSKGIAVFNQLIGSIHSDRGEYDKAIAHLQKAYSIHTTNRDLFNATSALNNIGTVYLRSSRYSEAIKTYLEALKVAETIPDNHLISICLDNIAVVYGNQNNFTKALDYHFKSLRFIDPADNSRIAVARTSIANTYLLKKDTAKARSHYTQALHSYETAGDSTGLATVYTNFSVVIPDYYQRLDYKLKAQRIWDKHAPAHTTSLSNIGNIAIEYLRLAQSDTLARVKTSAALPDTRTALLQLAGQYLEQGINLSKASNDAGNLAFLAGLRAEVAAEKGDFKQAYADMEFYHAVQDSLYSQEAKNTIAEAEGTYALQKKNAEIAIQQLTIANQQKIRIGLITSIGLLTVIGGLLYRQSQTRRKTNTTLLKLNTELDEANKVKARFFAIISHDLRSPIASLVNFLHLQKEAPDLLPAEQAAKYQQTITESAESLLETMETLLLWSKEQMDSFKPKIRQVTVSELFGQLQKSFPVSESLHLEFSNPENLTLATDENYLQTIMYNLTSNAAKALKQTPGARIEWKAFRENNQTVLAITDNGPGIPKATTEILTQETVSVNSKTGLGLHLVRDLAKAIQCSVTVQTQPNLGTTFYLYRENSMF